MSREERVLPAGGITSAAPQPQPVVHADRRVTFRIEAPDAARVQVAGRGDQSALGAAPHDLVRGADGVWTGTLGPVREGLHYYELLVDGCRCLDPRAEVYFGWAGLCHALEVPGDAPAPWDPRDVPHGEARLHVYPSRITGALRRAVVYTPPDYDRSGAARYPVLYLQHGSGESERAWTWQGKANFLLDNLIADGRARAMIVVMENGYAAPPGHAAPGRPARGENLFERVWVEETLPEVDRAFRTLADREHRAAAGLSMGAGQALRVGLTHPELFAWIGAFSGGGRRFDLRESYGGALRDAAEANRRLRLLWIGCGRQDRGFSGARGMHEALADAGIEHVWFETEGAHEWHVWRQHLHDFAPRLFREQA